MRIADDLPPVHCHQGFAVARELAVPNLCSRFEREIELYLDKPDHSRLIYGHQVRASVSPAATSIMQCKLMSPKQCVSRRCAPKQSGEGVGIIDKALVEIGLVREMPRH